MTAPNQYLPTTGAPPAHATATSGQSVPDGRGIFCHSRADDYGLPPAAFRLVCHIARRDGGDGCWASIGSMATTCRLHENTVRRWLPKLEELGLITREKREGYTTIHRLAPMSQWQAPPSTWLQKQKKRPKPRRSTPGGQSTIVSEGNPYPPITPVSTGQEGQSDTPHHLQTEQPLPHHSDAARGSQTKPAEGIPPKEIQREGNPDKGVLSARGSDVLANTSVSMAKQVLDHLNSTAGTQYQPVNKNLVLIRARLQEVNGDVAGVCKMIDQQCACWKTNLEMRCFLRPSTLFGPRFHDYYGQRAMAPAAATSLTQVQVSNINTQLRVIGERLKELKGAEYEHLVEERHQLERERSRLYRKLKAATL